MNLFYFDSLNNEKKGTLIAYMVLNFLFHIIKFVLLCCLQQMRIKIMQKYKEIILFTFAYTLNSICWNHECHFKRFLQF